MLSASLLLTFFAGTSFAATGSLTCTVWPAAPTDSIAFGAAGSTQSTTDPGTFTPGTLVNCQQTAVPANGVGGWSVVGGQQATLPAPTAASSWFILGSSANPGNTRISYTAADGAVATVRYNLNQLAVTISGTNPQLTDAPTASAANAIGNGPGGTPPTIWSIYTASSGTPTATGACTAAPGVAAPAGTTGTATSTLTTSQGTTCRGNFTYTVNPQFPGTVNFAAFTVSDQSPALTVWDATVTCTPPGTAQNTDGAVTGPTAVSAGTNVINCVAANGTGVTGTFTTTGTITPNGGGNFNATGGTGTITYTTNKGTAHTFSYTVAAVAPTITCLPAGPNIALGSNVTCTFTANDPTNVFVGWTQNGAGQFTPNTSANPTQVFNASAAGGANIVAHWTTPSGPQTQSFHYNIQANGASCVPADGSTIMLGSTVTCQVTGDGVITVGPTWTHDGNFSGANPPGTNPATFTASNTGNGNISVTWTDTAGAHGPINFSYQIVNNVSGGSCAWAPTLSEARGGAAAGPTTLTCTEGAVADFGNGFSFRIHKAPAAPGAGALHFDTTKAISVIAPTSLGLTASYVNDTTILIQANPPSGHTDQAQIEQFTLGNIFDSADAGTTLGSIVTTVTNSNGAIGNQYFIGGATANATGTMTAPITNLQNNFNVTVSSTCPFAVTGGGNSVLTFTGTGDTVTVSAVSGVVGGVQNITITGAHGAESGAVTQTVANCNTFPSIGTVVDALILASAGTPIVNQGQTNQGAGSLTLTEQALGFIPTGTVCTGSITEPGVVFSNSPTIASSGNGQTVGSSTLSGDRKSFTFTVTHASTTAASVVTISNINYDVDATTSVAGDFVKVTVTCGSLTVSPTGVNNAVVGNSINISATVKTVFIAQNDQESGIITIDEVTPGTFGAAGSINKAGTAAFNTLTFCTNNGASYTRAPWLVVTKGGPATTPSSDGLQLLNTTTHQGTNQQQGVLSVGNTCATFTFYSGSTTTAGELQLVGGVAAPDTAHGAGYNIAAGALVGPVQVSISGLSVAGTTVLGVVVNALKQFKSDVTVTATSAPFIAPGTIDGAAGDIVIAATDTNAQFVNGERIECDVLNSAFNENNQVFLESTNQNEIPVVTTTGTGMVAHLSIGGLHANSFTVVIDQAPTNATLGTITVSNIHYTVVSGSTLGPVIVECSKVAGGGSSFDQFVSNANIGTAPPPPPAPTPSAIRVLGAYGKTTTGPYNNNQTFLIRLPLVKTANDRLVTLDIQASAAGHPSSDFQGLRIQICIATKANPEGGAFGGFNTCTTRALGGFLTGAGTPIGNEAWYFASSKTPAWISIRMRLLGNATIATSPWAQTVQIHWTSHTGKSVHA